MGLKNVLIKRAPIMDKIVCEMWHYTLITLLDAGMVVVWAFTATLLWYHRFHAKFPDVA